MSYKESMGEDEKNIIYYLEFLAEKNSCYRDMIEFNKKNPVAFRKFLDDFITNDLPRLAEIHPELKGLQAELLKKFN